MGPANDGLGKRTRLREGKFVTRPERMKKKRKEGRSRSMAQKKKDTDRYRVCLPLRSYLN